MPPRYHLQVLSIGCWVLSAANASVAPQKSSWRDSYRDDSLSTTLEQNPLNDIGDSNNEFFKENEDWWKDPFAMFEDEEEDDDSIMNRNVPAPETTKAPNTVYDVNDELELFTEPKPPVAPPQVEPMTPPSVPKIPERAPSVPKIPETASSVPEIPVAAPSPPEISVAQQPVPQSVQPSQNQIVNPLVEQATAAPVEHSISNESRTKAVAKFGEILKSVPFVQVLLSFAFVKVIQPVMERIGDEYEHTKAPEKKVPRSRHDDYDDRRDEEEEELHYSPYSRHKKLTRGGGSPSVGWFPRLFGVSKKAIDKLPPARDLMDQVEYLQLELATIKGEKESMEREYEKASWQLQESQNEMANLQSTTNYLKAQLRDNQEVMDRAVRAERRKARDELTKMKEAMLQVLQRERQELRAKMMKQTAEVQAILKDREAAESQGKISS